MTLITQTCKAVPYSWFPCASMNVPRKDHGLILLPNGNILCVGGVHYVQDIGSNPVVYRWRAVQECEVYDPVADAWYLINDPGTTMSGFISNPDGSRYRVTEGVIGSLTMGSPDYPVLLKDGTVMVMGSWGSKDQSDGKGFTGPLFFNPTTSKWSTTHTLPISAGVGLYSGGAAWCQLANGNSISFSLTGYPLDYQYTAGTYTDALGGIHNRLQGSGQYAPYRMHKARTNAVLLRNGNVLLTGTDTTSEVWNQGTMTCSSSSNNSMVVHNYGLTLSDGRVIFLDKYYVEIFVPGGVGEGGGWYPRYDLRTNNNYAFSRYVLLSGDRVMVVGNHANQCMIYSVKENAWSDSLLDTTLAYPNIYNTPPLAISPDHILVAGGSSDILTVTGQCQIYRY